MSQTLTSFCLEQQEKLRLFAVWWVAQNKKDPDAYPMALPDENTGLWEEMFQTFDISWVQANQEG